MTPAPTSPTRQARRSLRRIAVATVALLGCAVVATGPASPAAAVPTGPDHIVSLGDSFVSGEGGRWAGNTRQSSSKIDALGPSAYWDAPGGTAEAIEMCHRSRSAPVHIGGGVQSVNLACSGARTATDASGDHFKPGIDFYDGPEGQGQALALQELATTKRVRMIVLSIGGNDFDFAGGVQTCIVNYLTSPSWWPNHCNDDTSITQNFTAASRADKRARIEAALLNVETAMSNAGYTTSQYTIVVQTYPRPLATNAASFRYPQSGLRHTEGGCGFYDADAAYAADVVIPAMNAAMAGAVADSGLTNVKTLDVTDALSGRRLCERGVDTVEKAGLTSWQSPGAVDRTEWTQKVRTITAVFGDAYIEESVHPNYWGQLALRNCVRQAYNAGNVRGGTCTRSATGLNGNGEPKMVLQ